MRLFLAIELPDAVRKALSDLASRLKNDASLTGCSWVRAQNLHVTLKFFGEVPDTRVSEICEALKPLGGKPMMLRTSRLELLPPRGPVRVIAAGLEGDLLPLEELHAEIETRCARIGFPSEGRRFRPHITLARARRALPPSIRQHLAAFATDPPAAFNVDHIVLMESRLNPDAAHYIPLARIPL